jgi:hypothetical protein
MAKLYGHIKHGRPYVSPYACNNIPMWPSYNILHGHKPNNFFEFFFTYGLKKINLFFKFFLN